jgi:pyridoxal/pyridoxine/pyridoxamine kinase
MPANETFLPFECLCVAVERARQLHGGDDGPWTVGVRDGRGDLLASAMLDSYLQVKAFAAAMEDLGFVHSILEAQEETRCCDFTFRIREAATQGDELLHA